MESQVYVWHSARHYFCLLLSACRKLYSEDSLKELMASLKEPGLRWWLAIRKNVGTLVGGALSQLQGAR